MSQWRVAVPSGCEVGDRPMWDAPSQTVVWSDLTAGQVHRAQFADWSSVSFSVGEGLGAVALRTDGGLVAASGSAFSFWDAQGRRDADPVDVEMPAGGRFNDAACDPRGRLLAGTATGVADHPNGVLWSLAGRDVRLLMEGITESNGVLYYVDSGEPVIRRYAYDVESGSLGQRLQDLAVTGEMPPSPDGLVVDSQGCVWVAIWRGGDVRQYSPEGDLLLTLTTPVSRPTCPVFAGPELDQLVITTGWEELSDEQRAAEPWAGHLLITQAPVRGLEPFRFMADAR